MLSPTFILRTVSDILLATLPFLTGGTGSLQIIELNCCIVFVVLFALEKRQRNFMLPRAIGIAIAKSSLPLETSACEDVLRDYHLLTTLEQTRCDRRRMSKSS